MNYIKNHIEGNFTTVPNGLINDPNLKDRAKFIFILLASKPDNWSFRTKNLAKDAGIHWETFVKYRNSLVKYGWILIEEQLSSNGRFKPKNYHLFSKPTFQIKDSKNDDLDLGEDQKKPSKKNSVMEKSRDGEKPYITNKESYKEEEKEKKILDNNSLGKNSNSLNPRL
jgi:hypothetical protein|tara:strand:- start:1423 stop:1929 length:507 start_codon:yes stop_codon:yes gene_type:complete